MLTIERGAATATSPTLELLSSGAEIRGYQTPAGVVTHGTVRLAPNAEFLWKGGTLGNLTVHAERSAAGYASISVEGIGNRWMHGVMLDVSGKLNWLDGNVVVNDPSEASSILIHGGGVFNITADGDSWTGGPAPGFRVTNEAGGVVSVDVAGSVTLGGDYLTSGTTHIKHGTLVHKYKAEQLQGVYKLDRDTRVKVTGSGPGLQIYNGDLEGGGTVEGNLNLGFGPADAPPGVTTNAARIHPLIAQGEVITVTDGMHMHGTGGTFVVDIDKDGKYSRIAVGGTRAILAGTLEVHRDTLYRPDGGALTIINAPAAVISSDFTWFTGFDDWNSTANNRRMFQRARVGGTYLLNVVPFGGGGAGGPGMD